MKKKYFIYGPVQDGMFSCWQVIDPRAGVIAVFNEKSEAVKWIEFKTRIK